MQMWQAAETVDNEAAAEEDPDMQAEISSEDYSRLQELVDEQEKAITAGAHCCTYGLRLGFEARRL